MLKRLSLTMLGALVLTPTSVAGQAPPPTQTQKSFTCLRTVDVIGDGFMLDCDVATDTSPGVGTDFTIRNVRRYKSSLDARV